MSEHTATISWTRAADAAFVDKKYSRGHEWKFDGGVKVPGSSSPANVPTPFSVLAAVDPEEGFVASLSSCHMLWFLAVAAQHGFVVDSYTDQAVGSMGKTPEGKKAMTRVVLRPEIRFSGEKLPTAQELAEMHHQAHEECYIANSVTTEVVCEPVTS
jgi:organic hydroperoxide reductase OsmC/OhrA